MSLLVERTGALRSMESSEYQWIDVSSQSISPGDVLRVKNDAYSSSAGKIHNGRLVRVHEVKDGDVRVATIDLKTPHILDARHAPHRLEKKVSVS
jgi:hypothetical protein